MPIPLPVIPDTFRCALEWAHTSGQTAVNVIHIGTAVSGKTPAQVFAALDANVDAAQWDMVSSGASVAVVSITKLDGVSGTVAFPTGSPAKWTGNGAGDFVPAASVLLKLQTGLRGRNHRGRIFIPFITEGNISNGELNPAEATAVTASWVDFQADLQADATTACAIVVAAYDRRHQGAGAGAVTASALSIEVPLATQRRRQGRLR
jgi:hypothetical protein